MRHMIVLLMLMIAPAAYANHPGEQLGSVTAAKEAAFEPTGLSQIPPLDLQIEGSRPFALTDLAGRVIVLSVLPPDCGLPCSNQQAILTSVQQSLNVSPMRDMVSFVTLQQPDARPNALWDGLNWFAAVPNGNKSVAASATPLAEISTRDPKIPMVHIFDKDGRHSGIFHGAEFSEINMVLYINGLTNAHPHPDIGFWGRVWQAFQ
ncbi:hypothetical protein [Parasedimentitalea psychrophila]|uniref:Cytochrome-c oxidase n=1 Tax=Parasedimentitalea psychrophila TaxID=2997337 RepID=A0A9Y2KYZ8_9RHOB|nr:hypothetical protein [Parasedimentitalea psychrophila]WIY25715.1 hypothetical protein QPJ95_01830 [Parasedimentitalea psychrophila]